MTDARTTPPRARLGVLVLLGVLIGYFAACFTQALGPTMPRWAWAGNWQMFTLRDPGHSTMVAEASIDGVWTEVDLVALFPTQWDSGVRFGTSGFRSNPTWMRTLAAATCGRHPDEPDELRFTELRWKKRLGRRNQSPRKPSEKLLLTWPCDQSVALPRGRRL